LARALSRWLRPRPRGRNEPPTYVLAAALARLPEAVLLSDAAGSILFVNDAAEALLGCTLAEARDAPLGALFERFDLQASTARGLLQFAPRPNARAEEQTFLLRPRTAEGASLELRRRTLAGADGAVCAVLFTCRAADARARTEEELHRLRESAENERRWLTTLLGLIDDEVYFTDPDRRYTYANPAAMREFGHESVRGIPVQEIIREMVVLRADGTRRPADEAPPIRALGGEIIRGEEQILRTPRAAELRYRQVSAAPVRDPTGRILGSVSMVRDITRERRAEITLREADHRRGVLLAILSHALRAPLARLRRAAADGAGSGAGALTASIDRLEGLLDDLLDLSGVERGELLLKRSCVSLRELIDEAIGATRPLLEQRSQRLQLDLPAEPLLLDVDARRIAQVLTELLDNAARFTAPGGSITLGCVRREESVAIFVRDTGSGIAPEQLAELFRAFTRQAAREAAREAVRAAADAHLGCGLALARALIELHEGRLQAYSAGRDLGSTFTLVLPRSALLERAGSRPDT
jgi:signal transduction histidine kinase